MRLLICTLFLLTTFCFPAPADACRGRILRAAKKVVTAPFRGARRVLKRRASR